MSNQSSTHRQIEQHLQLWIYLLPVVGVIPAIWTLSRSHDNSSINSHHRKSSQRQKACRLSIKLILVWLSFYTLFTLSAANASEIISFRFLYANAIITTGYFVACTWLMSRLGKRNLFGSEEIS